MLGAPSKPPQTLGFSRRPGFGVGVIKGATCHLELSCPLSRATPSLTLSPPILYLKMSATKMKLSWGRKYSKCHYPFGSEKRGTCHSLCKNTVTAGAHCDLVGLTGNEEEGLEGGKRGSPPEWLRRPQDTGGDRAGTARHVQGMSRAGQAAAWGTGWWVTGSNGQLPTAVAAAEPPKAKGVSLKGFSIHLHTSAMMDFHSGYRSVSEARDFGQSVTPKRRRGSLHA